MHLIPVLVISLPILKDWTMGAQAFVGHFHSPYDNVNFVRKTNLYDVTRSFPWQLSTCPFALDTF